MHILQVIVRGVKHAYTDIRRKLTRGKYDGDKLASYNLIYGTILENTRRFKHDAIPDSSQILSLHIVFGRNA